MSDARDQVYSFINRRGEEMTRYGPPVPYGRTVEPGSDDDLYLHGLLNRVEDDRAHAEAEKLRALAEKMLKSSMTRVEPLMVMHAADVYLNAASTIDPYEMRDGRLVRKSDGEPVIVV